jgi:hypothetical protein
MSFDKLIKNVEDCLIDIKTVNIDTLVFNLDILYDEIRSGEIIEKKEELLRFLKICQIMYDKFEHLWHFLSMTSFTLQKYYKNLKEMKDEIMDKEDIHIFTSLLRFSIEHTKREVRDSSSQSMGSLIKTFGEELLEKKIEFIIRKEFKKYEELEGYMMLLGYIVSNCDDISNNNFKKLMNEIIKYSNDEQFKSYSSYSRVQSLKGLNRIFQNKKLIKKLNDENDEEIKKLIENIEKIIYERLSDIDINVRKVKKKKLNNN